jgi:D-cysteine desulfhydrase
VKTTQIDQALARFPRERLTRAPTPLEQLPHLSAHLDGPAVWMKRDDLTDLALGGDKPRKLEYELAVARDAGADTIVTCGSSQSNNVRLTAAAARRLGMECAVVLSRDRYEDFQGNLLTVYLMGARVERVDTADHWDLEEHALALCAELRSQGATPHYIPVSGTTPRSCLGYVRAGLELADQLEEQGWWPDAIYTPFGTGGVFSGLLVALRARGIATPLIGISVNRDASYCQQSLERWWTGLRAELDEDPGASPAPVEIHDGFVGREYGDPTTACLDAILLVAQTEGVLLDPVYSGKMAAGFIAHVGAGRWTQDHRILLVHTGGVPALFAYHEALRAHLEQRGVSVAGAATPGARPPA